MDQAKLIGAAVAGLALIVFFFQNLQDVRIEFLFWDWRTDMIWALLVSALLGAVSTLLVTMLMGRRRKQPSAQDR
jgi:uncharacterized integral membrane protein